MTLRKVMVTKTEAGLFDYIHNFNKYTPEAIEAAVSELQRRGRKFTNEELREIKEIITKRTKAEQEEDDPLWNPSGHQDDIVTDPHAPLLYSKTAIRIFSVCFSSVFGAILLSSNIDSKAKKSIVIAFGIVFTAFTLLLYLIPHTIIYVLLLNTAGGMALTTTFWDKYVGKGIKYRMKPVWKPFAIAVVITIVILLGTSYRG